MSSPKEQERPGENLASQARRQRACGRRWGFLTGSGSHGWVLTRRVWGLETETIREIGVFPPQGYRKIFPIPLREVGANSSILQMKKLRCREWNICMNGVIVEGSISWAQGSGYPSQLSGPTVSLHIN